VFDSEASPKFGAITQVIHSQIAHHEVQTTDKHLKATPDDSLLGTGVAEGDDGPQSSQQVLPDENRNQFDHVSDETGTPANGGVSSESFSDIASAEGPWQQQKNKKRAGKSLQVTIKGNNQKGEPDRKVKQSQQVGRSLLQGAKREPSTLMYVKNLIVEERSNEEISKDVRTYGRMVGLRIMSAEIVRNQYREDVVGCRIRIPCGEVEKAMTIETWPDDVSCRKWGNRSNKEYSNRYNYGNQGY
jgi:hypothetical protein